MECRRGQFSLTLPALEAASRMRKRSLAPFRGVHPEIMGGGEISMNKQAYQCCFCENTIDSSKDGITSIIVIANWEKEDKLQQEQQLFCHSECLSSRLSKNIPLYIFD